VGSDRGVCTSAYHALLALLLTMRSHCALQDTKNGYLGGLDWEKGTFKWHPVMMVGGFIVVGTEGMLTYRVMPFGKPVNKKIHAAWQTVGVIMVCIGLSAVFLSHNSVAHGGYKANLYTAHSWVGIFVVTLYFFQWFMGFASFLVPSIRAKIASSWLPIHTFIVSMLPLIFLRALCFGILPPSAADGAISAYPCCCLPGLLRVLWCTDGRRHGHCGVHGLQRGPEAL